MTVRDPNTCHISRVREKHDIPVQPRHAQRKTHKHTYGQGQGHVPGFISAASLDS